jgi:hypothetical protein
VLEGVRTASLLLLLVAPGFLAIRGYSRRRYHAPPPERDIYALAQAVIVSAIWIAVAWVLLLLAGDPLAAWGVFPHHPKLLDHHRVDIVLLGLLVATLPYWLGAIAAGVVDRIAGKPRSVPFRVLRWTGLLQTPTAWDRAWAGYTASQGAGEVVVRLKGGHMVRGGYGKRAQVDLSPSPPQLYLESGYGYTEGPDGGEHVQPGAYGEQGVFIQGSEIEAVYFGGKGETDGQIENADSATASGGGGHTGS